MKRIRAIFLSLLVSIGMVVEAATPTIHGVPVDTILAQMTTREKATLLVGNGWSSMFMGIGMARPNHHHAVPGAAGETRAIPRLGIPQIILSDGPAGPRICANSHLFPAAMNLAATNDTVLVEQIGQAMGREAQRLGIHVLLAPGMNLTTNPLCGRNYEYYSADPELSARTARAIIRGMQSAGTGATAKHYAMNNVEHNRMKYNFIVDSLTEHDLYLRNWERIVRFESETDAEKPWCMMSSYNRINGEYAQLSPYLLDTILRQEWGYDGVVMTDWMFYNQICERVMAGNDLIMPGLTPYIGEIVRGVRHGRITEGRLNEAARRMLLLIARTTSAAAPASPESDDEIRMLIRRAGAAGCTWIKRSPVSLRSLSSNGALTIALYGTAAYHTIAGGTGSGFVRSDSIIDIATGLQAAGVTITDDHMRLHREFLRKRRNFEKVGGMSIVSRYMGRPAPKFMAVPESLIDEDAIRTDAAVLTIGRLIGEGRDLKPEQLNLSKTERSQLQRIAESFHKAGKPVIVLLNTPPYFETESWAEWADAILHIGYPGEEAGHSVADALMQ